MLSLSFAPNWFVSKNKLKKFRKKCSHHKLQLAKYSSPEKPIFSPENSTTADGKTPRPQLAEMVEALNVFDQLGPTVEHVFVRLSTLCVRALNDTVLVVQLLVKTGAPEATHFGQLIKIVSEQSEIKYVNKIKNPL